MIIPGIAYADESDGYFGGAGSSGAGTSIPANSTNESLLNNSNMRDFHQNNRPGYGERFTAGIIISIVNWCLNLFHVTDPVMLVFGKDPRDDNDCSFLAGGLYGENPRDTLVMGTFPEPFFAAISILYTAFERLLPIPLAIAIVIIAIILMLNSGTTEGRSKQKDYLKAFLVAFIALRFGHYLWVGILALNHFLIDLIWAYMMANGVYGGFFMDMIWGTGRGGFDETAQVGSIALAIILLIAAIMVLVLNFQYTMRMINLGILILIFPIVVTLSIFPPFRHSLTTWMQEFIANTVLQLAHAIALGGFFLTMAMPGIGEGAGFWLMITYFIGLPVIANLVRGLVGLGGGTGGAMGGAGAMMGLVALASMGRMLKPKNMSENNTGNLDTLSGKGASSSGGGFTRLSGATSSIGKAAQGAYNAVGKVATNKKVQGVAKVSVGATAALAGGMVSGMATGNPVPGVAAGTLAGAGAAKAGGAALDKAGSVVHSAVQGAVDTPGDITDKMAGSVQFVVGNSESMKTGGMAAQAGWGLQNAVNTVSTKMGYAAPFPNAKYANDFIKQNKEVIIKSTEGMNNLKPKLDVAEARYSQMKSEYGKGSNYAEYHTNPKTGKVVVPESYKKAEQEYHQIKAEYEGHKANAMQAQNNLNDYNVLQEYTKEMMQDDTSSSHSRGKL